MARYFTGQSMSSTRPPRYRHSSAASASISLEGWMATRNARKICVNGKASRQLIERRGTCDSSAMGGSPFPRRGAWVSARRECPGAARPPVLGLFAWGDERGPAGAPRIIAAGTNRSNEAPGAIYDHPMIVTARRCDEEGLSFASYRRGEGGDSLAGGASSSDSSRSTTGIWYLPPSQRPRSISLHRSLQKGKYDRVAPASPGCWFRPGSSTGFLQIGQSIPSLALGFRLRLGRGFGLSFGGGLGLGFGLGLRRRGVGVGRRGLGFAVARSALGAALLGIGGLVVRVGAVVGDVEPLALEDQPRPGAQQPLHLLLVAIGALLDRRRGDRLKLLKRMAAGFALVLVSGHRLYSVPGLFRNRHAGGAERAAVHRVTAGQALRDRVGFEVRHFLLHQGLVPA